MNAGYGGKRPRFSILIPTRNRGHLLPRALKSALNQNYGDYEIVVMANNPQDNTREVVQEVGGDRVRYFETDRLLPMPENWELAWTKATGDYVIYLCDDDALVPHTLETIAKLALEGEPPVVTWEDAIYYYPSPDWHDESLHNLLLLFYFGDQKVEEVPASRYLQACAKFEFEWRTPMPKFYNSAANREFFEGWRQKLGKLNFPLAPDYSFAWIANQVCESIRVIHLPLRVCGISDHSIGSNAGMGEAGQAFLREFGEEGVLTETVVSMPASLNLLAETFLRVNKAFEAAGLNPEPLDWSRLLLAVTNQLVNDGREWATDWRSYSRQLISAAKTISTDLATKVDSILSAPAGARQVSEDIRELRNRMAQMAADDPALLTTHTAGLSGDVDCAACALGLNRAVLADTDWDYLYVFGEEVQAFDPYAISLEVGRYYEMLVACRAKNRQPRGQGRMRIDLDERLELIERQAEQLRVLLAEVEAKDAALKELHATAGVGQAELKSVNRQLTSRLRALEDEAEKRQSVIDGLQQAADERQQVIDELQLAAEERLKLLEEQEPIFRALKAEVTALKEANRAAIAERAELLSVVDGLRRAIADAEAGQPK